MSQEERLKEAVDFLSRGHKDLDSTYKRMLTDMDRTMERICSYCERQGKKKKLEPWVIMSDITNHGSGVSSALYELYRRRE